MRSKVLAGVNASLQLYGSGGPAVIYEALQHDSNLRRRELVG